MKRSKKGFTLIEMMIVLIIMGVLLTILIPTWNYFITQSKISTQNKNSRVIFNAAQTECTKQKFQMRNLKAEVESLKRQLEIYKNRKPNSVNEYFKNYNSNYNYYDSAYNYVLEHPEDLDSLLMDSDAKKQFRDWQNIHDMDDTINYLENDEIPRLNDEIAFRSFDNEYYFYWDGKTGISCDSDLNSLNRDKEFDDAFADAVTKGIETPEEVAYKIHIKENNVVSVVCAKNPHDKNIGAYPKQQNERSNSDIVHFDFSDAEN